MVKTIKPRKPLYFKGFRGYFGYVWERIRWVGCAQGRTRTDTGLPPLAPQASVSTNSTTWA